MSALRQSVASTFMLFVIACALQVIFSAGSLYAQQPDLLPSGVVAPASANIGDQFIVRWTLTNAGTSPTSSFFLEEVYLSRDNVFDMETDLSVGTGFQFIPIPAGASIPDSATVMLPPDSSGSFYLFVVVDPFGLVAESNEANNVSAALPFTIGSNQADLVVSNVQAPSSANSGDSFIVRWRTTNNGTAATTAPYIFDNVYLSRENTFNPATAAEIGSSFHSAPIAAGGSEDDSAYVTIPADSSGSFYIFVVIDGSNSVVESNELNNTSAAHSIGIGFQQPDLVVSNVQAPASAKSGNAFFVRWRTSNNGTAAMTTPFVSDNVYLSRDSLFTLATAMEIGSGFHFSPIAAGASEEDSAYVTLPADSAGSFYIYVVTDATEQVVESNELNNTSAGRPIAVSNARPDLRVTQVIAPPTATSWGSFSVTYSVINDGTAPVDNQFMYDALVLSTDTIYDGSDQTIGSSIFDTTLAIGESYTRTTQCYVPVALSGMYYVLVKANASSGLEELDLNNNSAYSNIVSIDLLRPDLIVTQVVAPAYLQTGVRALYNYSIRNIGDTSTQGKSWADAIYISRETVKTDSSILVGFRNMTMNLSAGQTISLSDSFDLPPGLQNGTYYLVVTSDFVNQINESNDSNNTAASDPMQYLYTGPDFEITNVSVPPSIPSGTELTVQYTIRNSGNQPSPTMERHDAVYLSDDPVYSTGDRYMGAFSDAIGIDAGAGISRSVQVAIPLNITGTYYVIVQANAFNEIGEYIRDNNNGASAAMLITLGAGPDLQVTSVTVPDSVAAGDLFTIEWQVKNNGDGATGSTPWYDGLYLSTDTTTSGRFLGSFSNASALGVGQSYTNSATVVMPTGSIGTYRVRVITNASRQILETDDSNNGRYSSPIGITGCNGPELTVTSLAFPPSAQTGQQIDVTWQVTNNGNRPTAVPSWSDQVRLAIDTALSLTWNLGASTNPAYLGVGESYSQTRTVTIPNELNGDYYIVIDGDYNHRVDECNETNNRLRSVTPIQISIAPAPDLRVLTAVAPSNVFSGDTISLQFSVKNFGTGSAYGKWMEYFYISSDTIYDGAPDKYLGAVEHIGTLLPESSYAGTVRLPIPRNLFGQFHILARTDAANAVYEYAWESNNVGWSNPCTITLSPPPDLVVSSVVIPSTGNSGRNIAVSRTVQNQGPGPVVSGAWYDRVYIHSSPSFDSATARVLNTFWHNGTLAPDSTYTATDSVTLPDGYSGQFYIYVQTDCRNSVFEHTFEDNNILRSASTITIDLSPWPDLRAQNVAAPSTATAGSDVVVTFDVQNAGSVPTGGGGWTDRIYVSSSPTWIPSTARWLRDIAYHDGLQSGASYTRSIPVKLLDDISGTQYVYVYTDANDDVYEHTDEANNPGRSDAMLVAEYPRADLVIDTLGIPSAAAAGQPVSIQFAVKNSGAGRTLTSAWEDVLYLSVDTVLNTSTDVFLARVERREPLEPGESYGRALTPVLPDLPAGNYYVLVKADEREIVNDANMLNNTGHSPAKMFVNVLPPPDLLPTSVQFVSPATAGQPMNIAWTTTNAGAGATFQTSWFDGLYLSTDQAFDSLDIKLATYPRTGILGPSEAYTETLVVDIPNYVQGNVYMIVRSDILNDVAEGDLEINNALPTPVQVLQPPPGDLVVSSVSVPVSAVPGEDVNISWVTRNQGPNPVLGEMHDAVYVSANQTWDIADPLLGVVRRTIDLAPGASMQSMVKMNLAQAVVADSIGNITDVLPGVSVGQYHVIVRTDIRNNIPETAEQNNAGTSADQMNVGIPQLAIGTPASGSLTNRQKKYYRVDVGEGLDLRLRLTSDLASAANEVYVAFDRTPTASDFDFNASESFKANRELMIPSTRSGSYYVLILVRNMVGPTSQNYTIAADALPFSLVSLTPPEGGKGGRVTCVVNGAGFRDTTAFYLDNGSARIDGEVIRRINSTQAYVRFDLRMADYGTFNVVAANGSLTSTLMNAFSVVLPVVNQLQQAVYTPYGQRGLLIGRPATYDITVNNGDNNDHDIVILTLLVPTDQAFSLETDDFFARPLPPSLPDTLTLPNAGIRFNDDWALMTVMAKGVRTGQTLHARLQMKSVVSPCGVCNEQLPVIVDVRGLSFGEFLMSELDFMTQVRAEILKLDPSTVPAQVLSLLNNPDWQVDFEEGYREVGLLDDRPITGRTLPLVYDPLDLRTMKYDGSLAELLAAGARSLCSQLVNTVHVLGTTFGLIKAVLALGAGAEASFFFGALVVGGPIGWAVLAASAVVLAYGVYQLTQGEDMTLAKLICRKLLGSFDPNDIIGPVGYGDRKWIGITQTQPYTIRFENDPKLATAPAQVVTITQALDSTADARSFRLGRFGFRNMTFQVPENRSFYSARLDVRDSLGIYVDVNAGLDITKNEAFWIFKSVDPSTQQVPTDPLSGLLPINDTSGNGEGFVSYTIRASATSHTGDSLRAKATIVFDINPSINTPMVANTIDAVVPTSSVSLLPSTTNSTSFTVKWNGRDDSAGSGLRSYSIFVSVNDSLFLPWLLDVSDTMATYTGVLGNKYAFFSLATDNAGNIEGSKGSAEASTLVTGIRDLTKELPKEFALYQNYPNPFNPATTIQYDLPRDARVTLKIYSILGQEVATLVDGMENAGAKSVTFDARSYATGVYFYRLTAESAGNSFTQIKKMLLMK